MMKRHKKKPLNINWLVFPKWFMPTYVAFNQCTTEILLKSDSQLLITRNQDANFQDWLSWLIIIGTGPCATLQLVMLNRTFRHFKQLEVVPIM